LETLALIAYRQPITRGEIEEVRGVSVRSNIVRTLQEREWIRVVGHRDVPGKPALFGTTKAFLDYFNLESLDDLPSLAEIKDMESFEPELDLEPREEDDADSEAANDGVDEAAGEDETKLPPPSDAIH
jgi:segregation and condensation protein B